MYLWDIISVGELFGDKRTIFVVQNAKTNLVKLFFSHKKVKSRLEFVRMWMSLGSGFNNKNDIRVFQFANMEMSERNPS